MRKFYFLLLTILFAATISNAQIGVTVTNPTNTTPNLSASYTSLALALTDLNNVTAMSGPVTLTLAAGASETAPTTGLTIGSATLNAVLSAANSVTIVKAAGGATVLNAGVGTSTPGSAAPDGILKLTGADYITIDGLTFTDANAANPATMEFGIGLFKVGVTDGCNNNTIQNCIFNMQRVNNASGTAPMVDGAVGILVVNSTSTAATTALIPTAASGSNSNNRFYTNTINGGNIGIAIIGYAAPSPFTLADTGNDIGGASAGTGNQILNYGGAAGATNPAAAVRTLAQYNLNVSYNTTDNNNGAGVNHVTTLRGIYTNTAISASETITNNNVTVRSGATTSQLAAIENVAGATAAGNTVSITNNTITTQYATATSGVTYGIYNNAASAANVNINSNTLNLSTAATSGSLYGIYNTGSVATTMNVNSNNFSGITLSGASPTLTMRGIFMSTLGSTVAFTANANNITNVTFSGSGTPTGEWTFLYSANTVTSETVTNNTLTDCTLTPTVNAVSNQIVCNGSSTAAVNFSGAVSGTVYNWTNSNTSIGLGASGTGDIPSFTATNPGLVSVVATITVTPTYTNNGVTCTGASTTFTITVNPTPTVNPVPNISVCHNAPSAPVVFSGAVAATIFQWTNNTPSIGLPASGTGNIPSFIAFNPGPGPVTATITVTPTTNSNFFSQTFNFTGAVQTWVVPAGVTSVDIQAFGAQGNRNAFSVAGGLGGSASGTLAVAPGNTLYIMVGGGNVSTASGGFNGGGAAGSVGCATARGGGGGGASDVRLNVNALANRVIVAAGGGGAGGNRIAGCGRGNGGGGGGGYYGGGGGAGWPGIPPGGPVPTGGTQVAGGAGGITTFPFGPTNGFPGSLGQGGAGGTEVTSFQGGSATAEPGGIGGGLIGGSGLYNPTNNWCGQSGAGGSSYIGGVSSGITSSGVRSGNGAVTVSYTLAGVPVICTGIPTTFTITVNPPPTISCPANITVNSQPGLCGAAVLFPPATAIGAPTPVITYSHFSGAVFPVGTTTVTATATNSCGTASCTFTITVLDVEPPVITCPAPIVVSNDPNQCGAVVNYSVGVADNCQKFRVPVNILGHGAGAITVAGNNQPGGFYFDLTNNSATPKTIKSFMVRFGSSAFGAVSSPAPVSVYVTTSATTYVGNQTTAGAWTAIGANIPVTVGGSNSEFSLVPLPGNGFTLAPGETKGVYLMGTAASLLYNNAANSSFTPVSNGVLTLTPGQASSGLFVAAASPRVPNVIINYITLTQTAGLPSGSFFPVGITTNTFTATDDAGNTSASCSFTVRVNDTQAPTITCPANITVTTPVGSCTAVVNYTVTASDNCPGVITQLVSGLASGSAFPIGVNTVTWRAVDAAGNLSPTCSFTVTVLDAQLPVISQQPVDVSVCAGENASFSVTSTNAVSYQWQVFDGNNWNNIPGATSSTLTLSNVTITMNAGLYRVRVIGLCTTVNSAAATLYVKPMPTIVLTASRPPILLPGQFLTITAVVNPAGGTFVWRKNGSVIAGATTNQLTGLTVDDAGSYTCTYTLNGCTVTSAVMIVSAQESGNIYVYPNPNFGQFEVRFYNQNNEQVTLTVFNVLGQVIYQRAYATGLPYSHMQVSLGNVPQGSYLVAVINRAGQIIGAKWITVYH